MISRELIMIRSGILVIFLVCGFLTEHVFAMESEYPQLKAFNPAKEGQQRFVIVLPHKERGDEGNFKVEIIPGKTMLMDGVNSTRLGWAIVPKPLEGWGYTYYELSGEDIVLSTMMALPEGAQKKEEFVTGTSILIRYNSRLPIVIYGPEGVEIRYRIWQTTPDFKTVQKG